MKEIKKVNEQISSEDYKKFLFPKGAVVLNILEGLNPGTYRITFAQDNGKDYTYVLPVREKTITLIRIFARGIYSLILTLKELYQKTISIVELLELFQLK